MSKVIFKNAFAIDVWRIHGPNWEEVTGDLLQLHSEELHNMYIHFTKYYYGDD